MRQLILVEVTKERDLVPCQKRSVIGVETIDGTRQIIPLTLTTVETTGRHGDQ